MEPLILTQMPTYSKGTGYLLVGPTYNLRSFFLIP